MRRGSEPGSGSEALSSQKLHNCPMHAPKNTFHSYADVDVNSRICIFSPFLFYSCFIFGTSVIIRQSVSFSSLGSGSGRVCDCSLLTSVGSLIDSNRGRAKEDER